MVYCPPPFKLARGSLLVGSDHRLHFVDSFFIHDQLSVFTHVDLKSIHGPGRGTFEIKPALVITAAMTRTLELFLGAQPPRGAPQMRALGKDSVDPALFALDPNSLR